MPTLIAAPPASLETELLAPLVAHAAPKRVSSAGGSSPKAEQFANAVVLAILFAVPALMCVHAACAYDPDIWWHLRTGEWIVQHHAIPRVDPYSGLNAGKPWQAYSWLFELLSIQLFQRFGLPGIVGYSAAMAFAITVALRHLIQRLQADFTVVAALTFAACYSMGHLFTPRPWLFTILFFVLEVDILMHARRSGRTRELLWLPVIFALWSNLHIQFIDGLIVLALPAAESIAAQWGLGEKTSLRRVPAVAAFIASIAATLVNPYGWHIYRVAYDLASQAGVLNKITELQSIPFRDWVDFVLLFLALGATAALARTRRLHLFESALLVFAAVVSFRSQRDVWVMAVTAVAILASTFEGKKRTTIRLPGYATVLAAVAASVAVLLGFRVMHVNKKSLTAQVEKVLPVQAVQAVQAHGYAGPLYNDFTWGGYLIWSLRMPVSLDGRAAFYGDQVIDRSVATWAAEPDWKTDPALTSAGLVIGPVKAALVQVLRMDPRFRLVYEDKVAAVFVAQR